MKRSGKSTCTNKKLQRHEITRELQTWKHHLFILYTLNLYGNHNSECAKVMQFWVCVDYLMTVRWCLSQHFRLTIFIWLRRLCSIHRPLNAMTWSFIAIPQNKVDCNHSTFSAALNGLTADHTFSLIMPLIACAYDVCSHWPHSWCIL